MQIFSVCVSKGGTGKTTTAAALAQAAAYQGKKTLAIDLDPQGNLTLALGCRPDNYESNSYALLTGQKPAADVISESPQGLDIIGASWNLSTVTSEKGSALRLKKALEPVKKKYDVIVIDTPTSAELQYNAIVTATDIIIPLQTDTYNIQSLYQVTDIIKVLRKTRRGLSVGALITRYDKRPKHARQMCEIIQQQAEKLKVKYLGEIRQTIAIPEAATFGRSLFEYAPKSTAAQDYLNLYNHITQ